MRMTTRWIPVMLSLLIAPAALSAQQASESAQPSQQLPPEAQEVLLEMQQISERLGPIQQQALQDPEVQSAGEALTARIQEAMVEVDPTTPRNLERLESLMSEAQAAQQANDEDAFIRVVQEAQQIQASLEAAEAEAIQRPALVADIESFQDRVQAKMMEFDPEAGQLLERFEELDHRLALLLNVQ